MTRRTTARVGWLLGSMARANTAMHGTMKPTVLKSLRTTVLDKSLLTMSLSPATLADTFIIHKAIYGKADNVPFYFQIKED